MSIEVRLSGLRRPDKVCAGALQFLCQGVEDHVTLQHAMQGQQLPELQRLVQASGKMVLLDKLLPKLRAEGHKVTRSPVTASGHRACLPCLQLPHCANPVLHVHAQASARCSMTSSSAALRRC